MNRFMWNSTFLLVALVVASKLTPASSVVASAASTLDDCSTFSIPTTETFAPRVAGPSNTNLRPPMNSRPIGGTDTGTIQRISAIVVEAPKPCPLDRCVISDNKCVNPPATDPPATDPPVTDPPTPPSIASSTILSLDPITVASVNATATLPVNTSTTATVDAQIGELCLHLTATAPACPEDIVLMSSTSTQLAFNPITITSQDEETVSFTISNPFGVNLFALYYEYAAAETGSTKCYEESPLAPCHKPIEVTAHCMSSPDHPSIAVVDIWFVDSSAIDVTAKDTVPQCCQPDEEDALLPSMLFSFKIYCDSKCVLPK